MPRQNDIVVQGTGDDRMLSFGNVRVHNNHIQSGRSFSLGCHVCSEGLEGALSTLPTVEVKSEVAKSDGVDEEEDATPSSGSGDDW